MAERELNGRQEAFVAAYLGEANFNATAAARMAGYSSPNVHGYRLLENVSIRARIREYLNRLAMPAEEVLGRLARHARGTLRPFVKIDEDGTWKTNLSGPDALENFDLLTEVGYTEHGPKLKLVDTQAALVQLGRAHGLFVDKKQLSGPDGGPVEVKDATNPHNLSDEELQRVYRERLAKLDDQAPAPSGESEPGPLPAEPGVGGVPE